MPPNAGIVVINRIALLTTKVTTQVTTPENTGFSAII
jgi:hypothetical protein